MKPLRPLALSVVATLFACSSTQQIDTFSARPKNSPTTVSEATTPDATFRASTVRSSGARTDSFSARKKADPSHNPRGPYDALNSDPAAGTLIAHFIQVGQGDATLLELPNGTNILVDAGSLREREPEALKNYLESTLDNDRIDTLVVTHPDADHYNLLPFVVSDLEIGQVLYVGEANEHGATANVDDASRRTRDGFQDWLDSPPTGTSTTALDSSDIDAQGDPSTLLFNSGDTSIWVLSAEHVHDTNSRSIVLLVSYEEFDLLLTGDAEKEVEDAILARYDSWWLDVECLKLGHHGSRNATSDPWLEVTLPEVAIVSAAEGAMHGHPNQAVRSALEEATQAAQPHRFIWWENRTTPQELPSYDEAIYSTATNGTIVITTDGQGFDVAYQGSQTALPNATLRISAVLPNPEGDDRAGERVRILNPGSTDVSLADWRIADSTGASWLLTSADGVVAAGAEVEVVRHNRPMSLNNHGGDDVALLAPSGMEVDRHSYGDAATAVWFTF